MRTIERTGQDRTGQLKRDYKQFLVMMLGYKWGELLPRQLRIVNLMVDTPLTI